MRAGRSAMRRFLRFATLPIASAVASLVGLPAITSVYGADGWAAVAVGLAVGTALSVLVELGWAVTGPVRAARATGRSGARLLALATVTKLIAFAPVALVAGTTSALIVVDHPLAAALSGVSGAALGLSPAWYFIGRGQPLVVLSIDIGPRVLAAATASVALYAGAPLSAYPIAMIAAALITLPLSAVAERIGPAELRHAGRNRVAHAFVTQFVAVRGQMATALYTATPIVIVGIVAPPVVALFSAAERLQRMVLALVRSVPNALVGWVAAAPAGSARTRRTRDAIITSAGVRVAAGATFAVFGPWVADIVFSGVIDLSPALALLCGTLILVVCISRAVGGIGLVVHGRVVDLTRSSYWGAAIGVPALAVAPIYWGAMGAVAAEIIAELAVLARQTATLLAVIRRAERRE